MTLKQYITIMILASIFCWTSWWFVIVNVDPFQADVVGFGFFYVSLFLSLIGTSSIIAFLVRKFFSHTDQPIFRHVQKSFRDSVFVSLFLTILLYLQDKMFLHWWNAGVLTGAFLLYLLFNWSTNKTKKDYETN
jgi:Ca2+/Na+ antiporter